jgi:hypothetical protein
MSINPVTQEEDGQYRIRIKIETWGTKYGPRGAYHGCTGVLITPLTPEELYALWDREAPLDDRGLRVYQKISAQNAADLNWIREQYEYERGIRPMPDPVVW